MRGRDKKSTASRSIVLPTAEDLFCGRLEQNGVLKLRSVRAFDVTQWGVPGGEEQPSQEATLTQPANARTPADQDSRSEKPAFAQLSEPHLVLFLTKPVDPALAKRKRVEILVDYVENVPAGAGAERDMERLERPHVVRHLALFHHLRQGSCTTQFPMSAAVPEITPH